MPCSSASPPPRRTSARNCGRSGAAPTPSISSPGPNWDPAWTATEQITLVVQVNGKLRDRLTLPAGLTEAYARAAAEASVNVQAYTAGHALRKVIYVPDKLINLVVG